MATESSIVRSIRSPAMNRAPTITDPRWCSSGSGWRGWIVPRKNAETRNDTASMASVNGPETACTSSPAMLGPTTNVAARLPFVSELAST